MRGRHTRYSQELAERICQGVAQGRSLTQLSQELGMPGRATLARWLKRHPEFRTAYEAALQAGAGAPPPERPARPAAIARPRGYRRDIGERICERLAGGRSLLDLARDPDLPCTRTIYAWLQAHDARAVILRPDRYIVGVARSGPDLDRISQYLPVAP